MSKPRFPKLRKELNDFLFNEEGSIPRGKIASIGTMALLLTMTNSGSALAKHRSHASHRSHTSHINQASQSEATPSPVPVPDNIGIPFKPDANGLKESGFSAAPARSGYEQAENAFVDSSATDSSGVSARVRAILTVNDSELPGVSLVTSPASPGILPTSPGDLIPGTSQVEFNMETVNHQFNPFIESVEFSEPSVAAGKPVNTGDLPHPPGKPVN